MMSTRFRDLALLLLGSGVLTYIIVRALCVSMTIDECTSYESYVTKGVIVLEKYDSTSANNHLVNTAGMIFFEKVFGSNQFAIRFLNILCGFLYIFSTAMMCRKLQTPLIAIAAFLLLNTNPYIVQYFGMARGYGIATGCTAFAFWQTWLYFENNYRLLHLVVALFMSSVAALANFSYLHLITPAMTLLGIVSLIRPGVNNISFIKRLLPSLLMAIVFGSTLLVSSVIISKTKEAGGIWPTYGTLFWDGSVKSVIGATLSFWKQDHSLESAVTDSAFAVYLIASAGILFAVVRRRKLDQSNLFPVFVFGTLTLSGLSVVLQYHFLGTEMVMQRMCLFYIWPFFLLITFFANNYSTSRIILGCYVIITLAASTLFVSTMTARETVFSPISDYVLDAIEFVEEREPGKVNVLVDREIYGYSLRFYDASHNLPDFNVHISDTIPFRTDDKYYFAASQKRNQIDTSQWVLVQDYPNGNALYQSRYNVDTPGTIIPLNNFSDTLHFSVQKNAELHCGKRIADSIDVRSLTRVRVQFQMKRPASALAYHWLYCYRYNKIVNCFNVKLDKFPASDTWQNVEFTEVIPELKTGDDLLSATIWIEGKPIEIRNYKMTLEVLTR